MLVAQLAEAVGLRHAMLLVPVCYAVSGALFLAAERETAALERERAMAAAAVAAAAAPAPAGVPAGGGKAA